ncbi:hypothetical protein [Neokomagataea thailandica]|uniref:Uncharacterized protein n=1 Tax=Neokomagataea tanensis NBRC 106556 TaxID=1223519 RepID=A0ABQ0QGR1_9PROT|nr:MULTISPECIES: hypothetical protein [Neokomagataea]GBR44235.1 hypothetical protein AA106556_0359 [Neokomagataea tanensis NBRC 106556]
MANFNSYPRISSLTGDEVLVLADKTGTMTVTATAGQLAGVPTDVQASGAFYQDEGALVNRFADRLLVGNATKNPALSDRAKSSGYDWLSETMAGTSIGPWALQGAQFASVAQFGSSAIVAGSRTSDAKNAPDILGFQPSSIGVSSWAVSDDTSNPTTTTAYAFYGEGWRLEGVNYQPTFCMELEGVNFGGAIIGETTPYSINVGGGVYGIQLGVGGGQVSGTSDAAAGVTFVANPNRWQSGIVFGATALVGTDGEDSGYASAVSLARNQGIEWHTPVSEGRPGGVGAFVRSTVSERANGVRQEFVDNGVYFGNIAGNSVFSIKSTQNPNNTLQVQSGDGEQAAGIYVQEGAQGSANLGLYPAAGGELQITSPISNVSGVIPTQAGGGFLHFNVNGTDYRIPLLTVEQVGG